MLKRSSKITKKTLEMRTDQFPAIQLPIDSEQDAEESRKASYSDIETSEEPVHEQPNEEMDDAVKTVYTDVVINGLRDAGIDVSGLEQGIIEPLGKHNDTNTWTKTKDKTIQETNDLLEAFGSYNDAGNGMQKTAAPNTADVAFARFDVNLPDIDIPSFNMPSAGKRFTSSNSRQQSTAHTSNNFKQKTVETLGSMRYDDALGNTGSMTALDPDMLAAHGLYARNISDSAKRAFMAATAWEDANEASHSMTPLGTARTYRNSGIHVTTAQTNGRRYAQQTGEWTGTGSPRHAAPSGQAGTAAELLTRGYRKPTDDTSTFVALAEEDRRSGKRFRNTAPDDTSTFIALAEKSKVIIENGIEADGKTPFEKAKHVAKLAGAEAPIALALVATMTLGLGGLAATGRISDAGNMTSGISSGVNGIINQIGNMTTTAGAETTDDTASYPHETINMSDVLTGKQTQVMSWTGYCPEGWWFSGRTWPTSILPDSGQETVHDAWNAAGSVFTNHIATLNGRYLVAVKPSLGQPGQYIDITLENGTVIPAIVADTKGNENYGATDYKYVHNDGSILELEVDADYGIDKSTGNVKSSGNVQSWIPEWASLIKSVTKYERYV